MEITKIKKILKIKKYSYEVLLLTTGCFLMACGTSFFLLPNRLSSGGFAGLATITYYLWKIPLGTAMFVMNVPLLILSYFRVGKPFVIKSLLGTIILSGLIDILDQFPAFTGDPILACVYGGICMGIGTAIVLKASASTGGTDLLSYIVKSYKPYFHTSNIIVGVDTTIIALNVVFFRNIEVGLYSAIAIYLMGKMIDVVFEGIYFTKMMFIISNQYQKIAEKIGKEVDRGSTGIYAKGMYTNEKKMMLLCVGSRGEIAKIKQIALEIDNRAFIITANAREAWGKGFKR